MASDIQAPSAKREKVTLKPGFHLTDWMRLTESGSDLSGNKGERSRKITKAELELHSTEHDCWTVLDGKVYNVTQYMHYHPGGIKKIMMGAGKDCSSLFYKYHKWVNPSMISKCAVGSLSVELESTIKEDEDED